MAAKTRIAFIHATRVAIDPIETTAAEQWPEVEAISILEEGLSVDRANATTLTPKLSRRILEIARYAELAEADGVLFTCSAFGAAIEQADRELLIPVMKPNEAMFDAAFAYGDRIAMIYTFASAAAGMEQEFREAADSNGSGAKITSVFCDGAFDAKISGDNETHDGLIANAVAGLSDFDAILLAQFSMASAANAARQSVEVPILTSPEAAIAEMRRRIENGQRG